MPNLRAALLALAVMLVLPIAAAAQTYQIRPGDVLSLEVLEDESLNRNLLVLPDGRVSVPLAGSVPVAGRSIEQVRTAITTALAPNFAQRPNVFLDIAQLAETPDAEEEQVLYDVYVLGEANNTGLLQVEPGTTILQVFSQMSGFTTFAATKRVQLRRTDPSTGRENLYVLNYEAIQSGESPNGLVRVQNGDVILVPQRGLFE